MKEKMIKNYTQLVYNDYVYNDIQVIAITVSATMLVYNDFRL